MKATKYTMSWQSLPTAARWLILDNLRDSKCRQYESPEQRQERRERGGTSQAAYASVCREWNSFVEEANFEKLILHQDDIPMLGRVVPRCGTFIRWIWLRIELPSYDCSLCDDPESVEEDQVNKFIFTDAVWALFGILSQLNKSDHPGITLELSAHSTSIADHYAQELGCMINDTAWHTLGPLQSPRALNDRYHRWWFGQRRRITDGAALRLVGHPKGLRFDMRAPVARSMRKTLPKVKVVTALVIRGQCYRHFSVRKTLDPIIRNLTRLRDISYECWKGDDTAEFEGGRIRYNEKHHLLSKTFKHRRTLRKISMYEGTSRCNRSHLDPRWTWEQPAKGASSALAKASRNLDELYVNDIVEAGDFFQAFSDLDFLGRGARGIRWKNLKRISLFGKLVPSDLYKDRIRAAGIAARKMPQLQFMELWYCDGQHQCIFTYESPQDAQDTHKLGLRSSWGGRLDSATIQTWRGAVQNRGPAVGFEVRGQGKIFKLPKGRDLMCALMLRGDVLTKTSRRQISGQHGYS